LSDDSQAVVLRVEQDPFKPVVRRLVGETWTLTGEMMNLALAGALEIVAIGQTAVAEFVTA